MGTDGVWWLAHLEPRLLTERCTDQLGGRGTAVDTTREDKDTERVANRNARVWEDGSGVFSGVPRTLMSDTMPLLNAFWAMAEEYDDDDEE